MTKTFRYLLYASWPNYGGALIIGGIVALACLLTGGGGGFDAGLARMCVSYYNMIPAIFLMTALLSGVAYTTSCLNQVLSFGGLRSDYYRGLLLFTACNTLVYWLMVQGFSLLPRVLNWDSGRFYEMGFGWLFLILMVTADSVGCAIGPLYTRSRWAAALCTGLCTGLMVFYTTSISVGLSPGFWGDLDWIGPSVCALVALLCQLRTRYVVVTAAVR